MLYVGSDDGVYRFPGIHDAAPDREATAERVLAADSVMRLRSLDALDGLFAATASGLYHTTGGDDWTPLGVPREATYAVGASADGETLYAGTRPAAVYAAAVPDGGVEGPAELDWRECDGFQELPSREDWRLPRHEDLAHVRDVKGLPGRAESVVAGVEVGGVHASADRGDTWAERRGPITDPRPEDAADGVDWSARPGDVHDDVHELAVVDADTWVAATGFGLFRTTDAGASWTRLDDDVDRKYFRTVTHHDGVTYAAGALANSGQWDDPGEHPGFFAYTPADGLRELDSPTPNEVVTGVVAAEDGPLFAGTHRGSLLRATADGEWAAVGSFPTDDDSGTYTPLAWLAN